MVFILILWTLIVLSVNGMIIGISLTILDNELWILLMIGCAAMFISFLNAFMEEKREYEREHPKFDKYDYKALCSNEYTSGYSAGYRRGRDDTARRMKAEKKELLHEMYMQGRFDAIAELKHGTPEEHDD